jgi:eukaryotic-like serine/threonine-protein kinase
MSDDQFHDRYLPRYSLFERDFVVRTVAVDKILGREVLITRLEGQVGRRAAVQDRFREAARAAVRLSHPNVVALYDVGAVGGMPYVIQEYSHSEPLDQIMEHEGPFHPDDVLALVSQVADALDYANQRGLPHLALTPDVITVDYDGVVLVSDFGIGWVLAKVSPSEPIAIRYRAPEIVSVRNGDHRSDVYSLGMIAYEMLTGSSPFTGETVEEVREQVLSSPVTSPASVNPEVPLAVSRVIIKAISRNCGC